MNFIKRLLLVSSLSFIIVLTSLAVNPFYATLNQHDIIAKSYSKTQTSLDRNTCTVEGKDITTNLNCANINPQTLGDKNWVDTDNFQTSITGERSGEQGPSGPPGPPGEQGPPGPGLTQDLVHVVWDRRFAENSEIVYKRDGARFDPTTINLSTDIGISGRPAIAVSGQHVHVAWSDLSPSPSFDQEIFYARSIDGGATFSPTENISNDKGFSTFPAIAVSGNNVYVVWRNQPGVDQTGSEEIFYKRSVDGGATFGPVENLSNNDGSSRRPKVTSFDDNVYIVWQDRTSGNNEILYRRSTDSGATFNDIINLSNNPGFSQTPDISAFGDNVHIVWDDSTQGNEEIFYRRSSDSGVTFSNTINLSNNGQESASPSIAASTNNVHIVWKDELPPFDPFGNSEIFYRRSTDNGTTFGNTMNLSNNDGSSTTPSISVLANNVHVVWADNSSGTSEILYSISSNMGATFSPVFTNLSNNDGGFLPDIAVSAFLQ